jgi:competence ComEA-like helix-hairpin-helix protein
MEIEGALLLLGGVVAAALWPHPDAQLEAPRCELAELREPDRAPRLLCADDCGPACRPPAGTTRLLLGRPLDVDRASADELRALPGVGASLAARIVAEREAHGPFGSLPALTRVRGVGPRRVSRLLGWLVAGPAPPRYNGPSAEVP